MDAQKGGEGVPHSVGQGIRCSCPFRLTVGCFSALAQRRWVRPTPPPTTDRPGAPRGPDCCGTRSARVVDTTLTGQG